MVKMFYKVDWTGQAASI